MLRKLIFNTYRNMCDYNWTPLLLPQPSLLFLQPLLLLTAISPLAPPTPDFSTKLL